MGHICTSGSGRVGGLHHHSPAQGKASNCPLALGRPSPSSRNISGQTWIGRHSSAVLVRWLGSTSAQVAVGAYLGLVAVIVAGTRSTGLPLLVDTLCIRVEEVRVEHIMAALAGTVRVETTIALARGVAAYLLAHSCLMGLIALALV